MLLTYPAYGLAQDIADIVAGMWDDPNDAIEYGHDVVMYIDDVDLVYLSIDANKTEWENRQEQLVEGHIVFTTIQRTVTFDEKEGSLNVSGFVRCEAVLQENHTFFRDLVPVPYRIERVGAECEDGVSAVITPGAYNTSNLPPPFMSRTGVMVPLETPNGQTSWAEELTFSVPQTSRDGHVVERRYYAWSVPIFRTWIDETGQLRNLWMSLPLDRMDENADDRYLVIPADDVLIAG